MSRRLRSVGIVAVMALVALFTLVPLAGAAPRAAETKNVSVKDFAFEPKTITINVGDTIVWTNDGPAPHTVSADESDSFDSGNMDKGATFSELFDEAGTFAYYCKYHGGKGGNGMAGSIVVVEAAAAATAVPTEAPTAAPAAPTAAPAEPTAAPTAAPAAAPPAAEPSGSVDVANQPISNGGITVANVTAGQDGWIVAHLDEGGRAGKVLGQTFVKQGDNKNVAIKLSEDVPIGGKLWPMLHVDAGTLGTYEFPGADAPVVVNGEVVMKQITVLAPATTQPAPAPAPAPAPTTLPITGGEDPALGLLVVALGLLLAGALLVLRPRHRT